MMEKVIGWLKGIYEYLKRKKAYGKIGIGLIVLNTGIIPMNQTVKLIATTALILWAACYVASILPEGFGTDVAVTPAKREDTPAPETADKELRAGFVSLMTNYVNVLLDDELEAVVWRWGTEYSPLEYCEFLQNGAIVRLFLEDEEFDAADICLHPIPSVELINFAFSWFEETGRGLISEMVYNANAQGQKKLLLNAEVIPDFPEEKKWDQLLECLLDEGYKGQLEQDGISITWPRKRVIKKSLAVALNEEVA